MMTDDLPIKLKNGEYATSDISLATYFRFRAERDKDLNVDFIRSVSTPQQYGRKKRMKHFFVFKMTEEMADKLSADYSNSPFPSFEGIRRGLSKHSFRRKS